MRPTLVAALAIAAGLALVATSGSVVSRAQAQEATDSVFYGFISPDRSGALPQKVRATISDVTCGTADVTPLPSGLGFYVVTVASGTAKAGCGVDGARVTFLLLSGEVDDGFPAAQTEAWRVGTQQVNLSAVTEATFGAFVGDLPQGAGLAVMRWTGVSGTPIEEALATIPRAVESVTYWDVGTQSYRSHIPGAPEWVYRHLANYPLVDRDDIVFVRVR